MRLLTLPGLYTDDDLCSFLRHQQSVGCWRLRWRAGASFPVRLVRAQQAATLSSSRHGTGRVPLPEPSATRFRAGRSRRRGLEQTLKRLATTASVLIIVAHPDDEDGALLTYLTRGMGVRVTLLTLTRGEGGQNAMSAESNDALGLIRTNELLKADEYYGASNCGAPRRTSASRRRRKNRFHAGATSACSTTRCWRCGEMRPQVIVATFVGGVTDGHGQHQVSGEIAQEAFKAAADPKVFPEQLKDGLGLTPWQPLAVYSRAPFAPIRDKGMFD